MKLNTLVPLVLVLALAMVAAVVASPPQQTDFEKTATMLILNATATANAIDPGTRTQQAENYLATRQIWDTTRTAIVKAGETGSETRTAVAVTRDPL
ncbi:MAG: hypothetical protein AAF787_19160, partial [Chloroflexota bacterium]